MLLQIESIPPADHTSDCRRIVVAAKESERGFIDSELFDLVELADQITAERPEGRGSTAILHEVVSRTGITDALSMPGSGRLASAGEIFEAFVYPRRERLRAQLEQHFEAVALPRGRLDANLREGDLMIRQVEGNFAHLSVVASPELRSFASLHSVGLTPEGSEAGEYVQIIESGRCTASGFPLVSAAADRASLLEPTADECLRGIRRAESMVRHTRPLRALAPGAAA